MFPSTPVKSTHDDSPTHPIVEQLRWLAGTGDYPSLLRCSAQLAERARSSPEQVVLARALRHLAGEGPISALVAIESLVGVGDRLADEALIDLLEHPTQVVRRHAAWRLGDRNPSERALPALIEMVTVGGIDTMHAHRALRGWSDTLALPIARATIAELATGHNPAAQARLVDLLGVLGDHADEVLLHLLSDERQPATVRSAAIGALGERNHPTIDQALQRVAAFDETVATEAALALGGRRLGETLHVDATESRGLRVAQLVLAGGLDGQLSLGGRGDTGGVASLLVSLGEALARRADVDHVLTIGRGTVTDAIVGPMSSSHLPLSFGTVSFGDDDRPGETADEVWEQLPAIERGLRRALRSAGPIDVLHLRMADAGTLAGAHVASELGIPVCFSVAPDPHNVIESLHARGELDDDSFVRLATDSHVWFRARLIEGVARDAEQLALFPRSEPIEFLQDVEGGGRDRRQSVAVVAEGIDVRLLARSAQTTTASRCSSRAPDVLDDLATELAPFRRGLPLVISVGRMNPVKGMERVVAAWAADPQLRDRCNLVLVGGDLAAPSTTERAVLDAIDRSVPVADPRRAGLVLLGGRPRVDVARLLNSAVAGRTGDWAEGGVYVDGAVKEEFGLAVLEAMAAGLVVVAPSTGGPSTYVDDDDTGVLVAPDGDLGSAIHRGFGLVDRTGRAERARDLIERHYSIDTMAAQLVDLYQPSLVSR